MPFQPTYDVPPLRRAYTMPANNGRIGVLMLHGFMGSPLSSRAMSEYLHEQGITVHCPLLPGHGHWPDKYKGVGKKDWLAEAEEGLNTLQKMCDEVFIIGHSMGNVLGAHLIQTYPIQGLIMLAPTYDVPDQRLRWLMIIRYIMPWFNPQRFSRSRKFVRNRVLDLYPDFDFEAPGAEEQVTRMARIPTSSIDEMRKVLDMGKLLWGKVTIPAFIFEGEKDHAIFQGSGQIILDKLGSTDKSLKTIPDGQHEFMRPSDPHHLEVWQTIHTFIQAKSAILDS